MSIYELQASQGNIMRTCLKKKKKHSNEASSKCTGDSLEKVSFSQDCRYRSVDRLTTECRAGRQVQGCLDYRTRSGIVWSTSQDLVSKEFLKRLSWNSVVEHLPSRLQRQHPGSTVWVRENAVAVFQFSLST